MSKRLTLTIFGQLWCWGAFASSYGVDPQFDMGCFTELQPLISYYCLDPASDEPQPVANTTSLTLFEKSTLFLAAIRLCTNSELQQDAWFLLPPLSAGLVVQSIAVSIYSEFAAYAEAIHNRFIQAGSWNVWEDTVVALATQRLDLNDNVSLQNHAVIQRSMNDTSFNGFLLPYTALQDLMSGGHVLDLGGLSSLDTHFQRLGVHPTIMDVVGYSGVLTGVPLDGLQMFLFARADVLDELGLELPVSWEELLEVAAAANGANASRLEHQGDGKYVTSTGPLHGFCMPPSSRLLGSFALAVLAPLVQQAGPKQGMYLNAETLQPAVATAAMPYVLSFIRRLSAFSAAVNFSTSELSYSDDFALGHCAFTVGTAAQFRRNSHSANPAGPSAIIGITVTTLLPGSELVLSSDSEALVNCTQQLCPYAQPHTSSAAVSIPGAAGGGVALENHQELVLVNRAPLLLPDGLMASVYPTAWPVAQMHTWLLLSTVGGEEASWEILLSPDSEVGPWRLSHLDLAELPRWTMAGFHAKDTMSFLESAKAILDHPNVVLPLRARSALLYNRAVRAAAESVLDAAFASAKPADVVVAVAEEVSMRGTMVTAVEREAYKELVAAVRKLYGPEPPGGTDVMRQRLMNEYRQSLGLPPTSFSNIKLQTDRGDKDAGRFSKPNTFRMPQGAVVGTAVGCALLALLTAALFAMHVLGYQRRWRRRRWAWRVVEPPGASPDTVLLVTDIEGSTSLWEALPEHVMDMALRTHHATVRSVGICYGAYESATEGDSFILAFHSATEAAQFALGLQRALLEASWPLELLAVQTCAPMYVRRLDAVARASQVFLAPAVRLGSRSRQRGYGAAAAAAGSGLHSLQAALETLAGWGYGMQGHTGVLPTRQHVPAGLGAQALGYSRKDASRSTSTWMTMGAPEESTVANDLVSTAGAASGAPHLPAPGTTYDSMALVATATTAGSAGVNVALGSTATAEANSGRRGSLLCRAAAAVDIPYSNFTAARRARRQSDTVLGAYVLKVKMTGDGDNIGSGINAVGANPREFGGSCKGDHVVRTKPATTATATMTIVGPDINVGMRGRRASSLPRDSTFSLANLLGARPSSGTTGGGPAAAVPVQMPTVFRCSSLADRTIYPDANNRIQRQGSRREYTAGDTSSPPSHRMRRVSIMLSNWLGLGVSSGGGGSAEHIGSRREDSFPDGLITVAAGANAAALADAETGSGCDGIAEMQKVRPGPASLQQARHARAHRAPAVSLIWTSKSTKALRVAPLTVSPTDPPPRESVAAELPSSRALPRYPFPSSHNGLSSVVTKGLLPCAWGSELDFPEGLAGVADSDTAPTYTRDGAWQVDSERMALLAATVATRAQMRPADLSLMMSLGRSKVGSEHGSGCPSALPSGIDPTGTSPRCSAPSSQNGLPTFNSLTCVPLTSPAFPAPARTGSLLHHLAPSGALASLDSFHGNVLAASVEGTGRVQSPSCASPSGTVKMIDTSQAPGGTSLSGRAALATTSQCGEPSAHGPISSLTPCHQAVRGLPSPPLLPHPPYQAKGADSESGAHEIRVGRRISTAALHRRFSQLAEELAPRATRALQPRKRQLPWTAVQLARTSGGAGSSVRNVRWNRSFSVADGLRGDGAAGFAGSMGSRQIVNNASSVLLTGAPGMEGAPRYRSFTAMAALALPVTASGPDLKYQAQGGPCSAPHDVQAVGDAVFSGSAQQHQDSMVPPPASGTQQSLACFGSITAVPAPTSFGPPSRLRVASSWRSGMEPLSEEAAAGTPFTEAHQPRPSMAQSTRTSFASVFGMLRGQARRSTDGFPTSRAGRDAAAFPYVDEMGQLQGRSQGQETFAGGSSKAHRRLSVLQLLWAAVSSGIGTSGRRASRSDVERPSPGLPNPTEIYDGSCRSNGTAVPSFAEAQPLTSCLQNSILGPEPAPAVLSGINTLSHLHPSCNSVQANANGEAEVEGSQHLVGLTMSGSPEPQRNIATASAIAYAPAIRPPAHGSLLELLHRVFLPMTVDEVQPAQEAPALLVFAGLRVRVGLGCGVTDPRDIQYNVATARMTFSGEALRVAKAVCDCASGGQIIMSSGVLLRLQLSSTGGVLSSQHLIYNWQAHIIDLGDHQLLDSSHRQPPPPSLQRTLQLQLHPEMKEPPLTDRARAAAPVSRHLLHLTSVSLLGRLSLIPPVRSAIRQYTNGCVDAPVGDNVAVVVFRVSNAAALLAWNAAVAVESMALLEMYLRASMGPHLSPPAVSSGNGTGNTDLQGGQAEFSKAAVQNDANSAVDTCEALCYLAAAPPGSPFGTFVAGFSHPATAARWALETVGRLKDLPWPQELLKTSWGRPLDQVSLAEAEAADGSGQAAPDAQGLRCAAAASADLARGGIRSQPSSARTTPRRSRVSLPESGAATLNEHAKTRQDAHTPLRYSTTGLPGVGAAFHGPDAALRPSTIRAEDTPRQLSHSTKQMIRPLSCDSYTTRNFSGNNGQISYTTPLWNPQFLTSKYYGGTRGITQIVGRQSYPFLCGARNLASMPRSADVVKRESGHGGGESSSPPAGRMLLHVQSQQLVTSSITSMAVCHPVANANRLQEGMTYTSGYSAVEVPHLSLASSAAAAAVPGPSLQVHSSGSDALTGCRVSPPTRETHAFHRRSDGFDSICKLNIEQLVAPPMRRNENQQERELVQASMRIPVLQAPVTSNNRTGVAADAGSERWEGTSSDRHSPQGSPPAPSLLDCGIGCDEAPKATSPPLLTPTIYNDNAISVAPGAAASLGGCGHAQTLTDLNSDDGNGTETLQLPLRRRMISMKLLRDPSAISYRVRDRLRQITHSFSNLALRLQSSAVRDEPRASAAVFMGTMEPAAVAVGTAADTVGGQRSCNGGPACGPSSRFATRRNIEGRRDKLHITSEEADAAAAASTAAFRAAEDAEVVTMRGLRVRMGMAVGTVRTELCPLTGRLVYSGKSVTAAMTAAAGARLGTLYVTQEVVALIEGTCNAADTERLSTSPRGPSDRHEPGTQLQGMAVLQRGCCRPMNDVTCTREAVRHSAEPLLPRRCQTMVEDGLMPPGTSAETNCLSAMRSVAAVSIERLNLCPTAARPSCRGPSTSPLPFVEATARGVLPVTGGDDGWRGSTVPYTCQKNTSRRSRSRNSSSDGEVSPVTPVEPILDEPVREREPKLLCTPATRNVAMPWGGNSLATALLSPRNAPYRYRLV